MTAAEPITVIELFAGVGSQRMALRNLGIPHTVIGISEIDRHAIDSYNAIHGETYNFGDITKIEHLPKCTLLTYTFPCQDLSNAGLRKGMAKGDGTRSGLLWEVERLLIDSKKRGVLPDILLMENVDAILDKNNHIQFRRWISSLADMGYMSSYKVLNACEYGIAQSRSRCFMVSFLNGRLYEFPDPIPLTKTMKDYLETDVPEKYYLSEERIGRYVAHKERHDALGHGFGWEPVKAGERESARPLTSRPNRNNQNFIIEPATKRERESNLTKSLKRGIWVK